MELTLTLQPDNKVSVVYNGAPSHSFDPTALIPDENIPGRPPHPLEDPQTYGKYLFEALFPVDSITLKKLKSEPDRILQIVEDEEFAGLLWGIML